MQEDFINPCEHDFVAILFRSNRRIATHNVPTELLKAHQQNDKAVMQAYGFCRAYENVSGVDQISGGRTIAPFLHFSDKAFFVGVLIQKIIQVLFHSTFHVANVIFKFLYFFYVTML